MSAKAPTHVSAIDQARQLIAMHHGDYRAAEVYCWSQQSLHGGPQTQAGDEWGTLAGVVAELKHVDARSKKASEAA